MGVIIINGQRIDVPDGESVSIRNNSIVIGGNVINSVIGGVIQSGSEPKLILDVTGSLISLQVDHGDVLVRGEVRGPVHAGGRIECKDVKGNVEAGGALTCEDVGGNVVAGGSANCGKVQGSVTAGGSINCKR